MRSKRDSKDETERDRSSKGTSGDERERKRKMEISGGDTGKGSIIRGYRITLDFISSYPLTSVLRTSCSVKKIIVVS